MTRYVSIPIFIAFVIGFVLARKTGVLSGVV